MNLPVDEYWTGNTDDECYAIVYGRTMSEAKRKADKYIKDYPLYGYNTKIISIHQGPGYTRIHLDRWYSCD